MKLKKLRVYLLSAAIAASLAAGGTGVFADEITATPDSEVLELESAGEGDLQDSYDEELPGDEESYEGDTEDEFLEIAEEAYDGDDSEFLDIEIAATTVENAEEEEELTGSEQGDIGEVHWELSDLGVLEFTGTGAIRDYDDASAVPWAASAASVKTVSISGDISGIGNNALAKLENLTEVQMNDKVLSIGERAFSGDVKLGYITIPATTANIGKDAFAGHMENFYIKGSFYSKAEEYAAGNSIRFVPASTTSIATADISGIPASAAYTGAEIRPEVTVKINLTTLKIFDDYKVTYTNNTNVGTASVTIEGVGAYNGTVLKTFSIVGASIQGAQITGFINKVYDGSPKTQDISVILNGKTLSLNADYTISYAINVNARVATMTVTGKGNYSGTITKQFAITPLSLSGGTVNGFKSELPYTGSGVQQNVTVVVAGKTLTSGTDYTISYQNNVKRGKKAAMTITGKGNYKDTITKTFKIVKAKITKDCVEKIPSKTYTGKAIKPKVTVKVAGRTLKKNKDYKVKYSNNVNVGKATVTITGKGNYKGKVKIKFKIQKEDIDDCTVKGITDTEYTGKAIKLNLTVKTRKKTLKEGVDYTATYKNNVNVGTAQVILKGKGNFKGSRTETFEITRANIRNAKISGVENKGYTGKAVKQNPTITMSGVTLKENRDYTLSYKDNVEIGTATMTVTGKGNYTGQTSVKFKIQKFSLKDAKVSGVENKEYTGDQITQNFTVTYKGKALKKGTDYTYNYSNNVDVGTAYLNIIGQNSYQGEITKSFTILPQGVSITSAKLTNKRLVVTWSSWPAGVSGLQLQLSASQSFDSTPIKRDITDKSGNQYVMLLNDSSLKYVRIRTYQSSGGQTYYSKWRATTISGS